MSEEWLLMRKKLRTHRKTLAIAASTGLDADAVVGKLFALWSWGDDNTVDGTAEHVSFESLDEYLRHPGFAAAARDVGWLRATDKGVVLPNFKRFNKETAKQRALKAKRQAKMRKIPRGASVATTSPSSPVGKEANKARRPRTSRDDLSPAFETFWDAYPRRTARLDAVKAWNKLAPSPELVAEIMSALARQKLEPRWADVNYIPYPATWLNGRRWEDMPDATTQRPAHTAGHGGNLGPNPSRVHAAPGKYDCVKVIRTAEDAGSLFGAETEGAADTAAPATPDSGIAAPGDPGAGQG